MVNLVEVQLGRSMGVDHLQTQFQTDARPLQGTPIKCMQVLTATCRERLEDFVVLVYVGRQLINGCDLKGVRCDTLRRCRLDSPSYYEVPSCKSS